MRNRAKNAIFAALLWIGACALLSLGARLPVFFAGDIAGVYDPVIGRVFSAWKTAKVSLNIWIMLPCGLALAAWCLFIARAERGKKRHIRVLITFGGVFGGLVLFAGSVLLLLLCGKINGVPVPTIAEIVSALSGALS